MDTHGPEPLRVETGAARAEFFHLATEGEWQRYQEHGWITPPSLDSEGFVHCSWASQIPGTVAKHFSAVSDLVALRLDPGALEGLRVVEEDSYGSGQAFPHVYGAIPVHAVVAIVPLRPDGLTA